MSFCEGLNIQVVLAALGLEWVMVLEDGKDEKNIGQHAESAK